MKSSPANLLERLRDRGEKGDRGGERGDNRSEEGAGAGEERRPEKAGRHERHSTLRHTLTGYGEGAMPKKLEDYECLGLLFKRRGGMGRILGWKPRLFTLYRGTVHRQRRPAADAGRGPHGEGLIADASVGAFCMCDDAGLLCYYEADVPEDVKDWNKPRGSFDLTFKGVTLVIHKAPSRPDQSPEYIFSVVGGYGGDSRATWKLIADTEEDFDKWCKGEAAAAALAVLHGPCCGLTLPACAGVPPHQP